MLKEWLAWSLGNGQLIRIGGDPMVGFVGFYKLSLEVLHTLHDKGFFFLAQVGSKIEIGPLG